MLTINKKTSACATYVAGFKNTRVVVYGRSLAAAKQTATEHFRPAKKDKGLLWIELTENAEGLDVETTIS